MATVRISADLINGVDSKIQNIFQKRIETENKKLDAFKPTLCAEVYEGIPIEERQLAAQLQALGQKRNKELSWFRSPEEVTVRIMYEENSKKAQHNMSVKPIANLPFPMSTFERSYYGTLASLTLPTSAPSYPKIVAILLSIVGIVKERDELRGSIRKILDGCATLRQVLEVWPTALDFMPDDVIQKHNTKVKARTVATVRKDVIVDDATKAALLKARMLNGGND